jgi:peptidoglycan/LPS O-acetylase OafA/YrhL
VARAMSEAEQYPVDPVAPVATAAPATLAPGASAAARRLHFLDSVRALSALYVVAHHLYLAVFPGYPENTGPAVLAPLLYGQFGVAVFIVVSGFSLGLAPVRHDHELVGGFRRFIRRRAWRIIPPYWAALLVSVALVALVINQRIDQPLSLRGVLTHLFLVQDVIEGPSPNGAFWSIAVEWQLYFVFPVLLLVRRRAGAAVLCVGTTALVAVVKVAEGRTGVADKLLHLSPQFGALFAFGLVAAAVTGRPEGAGRMARWWGPAALAAAAGLVVACLVLGTGRSIDNLYWLDLLIGVAVAAGLAHLAGTAPGPVRRVLEVGPLVSVGQFSYSLYLVHAPLLLIAWLFVVEPRGWAPLVSYAVMASVVGPVIVAISYGFHLCVERPFLRNRSMGELWASISRKEEDSDLAEVAA